VLKELGTSLQDKRVSTFLPSALNTNPAFDWTSDNRETLAEIPHAVFKIREG